MGTYMIIVFLIFFVFLYIAFETDKLSVKINKSELSNFELCVSCFMLAFFWPLSLLCAICIYIGYTIYKLIK